MISPAGAAHAHSTADTSFVRQLNRRTQKAIAAKLPPRYRWRNFRLRT